MKVLVFAEQRNGKLKSAAFEALSVGARLAGSSADVAALVVGSGSTNLAEQLKGYGADKVLCVDDGAFENYNITSYAAALEAAIKSFGATCVIASATPMGRDLMPRIAARFDAGILTDLVEISMDEGSLSGIKPMYAGKCLANVKISNSDLQIGVIRQNVFAAENTGQGSATPEKLEVSLPESKIRTLEVRKGQNERPDLTEATTIISGGRSLGSTDNFKILFEAADALEATVGASRAAVDSGYASHDMQVGQTGKTVNPNLYIACGVSGSVQHMAGMRTSKVIVAINTDQEAPIFGIADYGIVADLFEAVPALTKKVQELKG